MAGGGLHRDGHDCTIWTMRWSSATNNLAEALAMARAVLELVHVMLHLTSSAAEAMGGANEIDAPSV
eukprot:9458720-Karenia_brevis.AAC.1